MPKDVGIQNFKARFELLDHDCSHYCTDCSKNVNNFGIENPRIFNTGLKIKKGICSLNTIIRN